MIVLIEGLCCLLLWLVDVGDLSGKHGSLAGLESLTATYVDSQLSLFGPSSVVGRSVVIHYNDADNGNPRWVCANIGYPREVTTVVTTFVGTVEGTITLKQMKDEPTSETSILVDLKYADGSAPPTVGHGWHVHETPVSGDCSSTGGHYDPADVTGMGNYNCDGSTLAMAESTCEVGDLANKHGQLELSAGGGKVFFTDWNLPLSGESSVASRSIVVSTTDVRFWGWGWGL